MSRRGPGSRAAAAVLAAALLSGPALAQDAARLIQGPRHSVSWDPSRDEAAELRLDPAGLDGASAVVMSAARPAGIDYRVYHGRQGVRLPVQLDDCSELFGCNVHYAIHSKRLLIEAASHDFDRDGRPELVFALGTPELGVVVNVVKYFASRRGRQGGQWRLVGRMEGPGGRVEVDGDSLTLPYGSLGLLDHWRLVKGRFVRMTS